MDMPHCEKESVGLEKPGSNKPLGNEGYSRMLAEQWLSIDLSHCHNFHNAGKSSSDKCRAAQDTD